jgi:hypothetical protein
VRETPADWFASNRNTEKQRYFSFGTLPALNVAWPNQGSRHKREIAMIVLNSARDTATAFAAAFLTAMLFVSTATSALPIA